MTRSIRKGQKKLRRHSKPHSYYAQSSGYWRKEIRHRDRIKDSVDLLQKAIAYLERIL